MYDVTFIAGATIEVFYPDTTDDVTLTYTLGDEVATAEATYPNEGDCAIVETTTTTAPATTVPGATTTSSAPPPAPTTTAAPPSTATTTVRPPSHLPETR